MQPSQAQEIEAPDGCNPATMEQVPRGVEHGRMHPAEVIVIAGGPNDIVEVAPGTIEKLHMLTVCARNAGQRRDAAITQVAPQISANDGVATLDGATPGPGAELGIHDAEIGDPPIEITAKKSLRQ